MVLVKLLFDDGSTKTLKPRSVRDFIDRVKWYYSNGLLSKDELHQIINVMSDIKRRVNIGLIPQRRGVVELSLVYKEYYII